MSTQQDTAQELRTTYDAQVAQINGSTTLTLAGQKIALAKLYVPLKDKLNELRDQQYGNAKTRVEALEKQVFGLPANASTTDTVSYRDALDRVTALDAADSGTPAALARMYETAKVSSDQILAKAIVFRAFDLNDSDLLNTYIADNPAMDGPVSELWDLIHAPQNNTVADFIFFLKPPALLSSMADIDVRNLAANGKITTTTPDYTTPQPFNTNASY